MCIVGSTQIWSIYRCKAADKLCMYWQAAGLSQRETNDLLDTYVHEQIEEKGAGETHM